MLAKTAFVALALVACSAFAAASSLHLAVGTVLRAPSGAEWVIEEELPYSPRLLAEQHGGGASMLQLNAHHKATKRMGGGAVGAAAGEGDYVMGQKIGQGGFGAIFKATRKGTPTHDLPAEVAIKVQTARDAHELEALKNEYTVQEKLLRMCPAHIVKVFEHWEHVPHVERHNSGGEFKFFMAMELMAGDLDHAMAARIKATPAARADVPFTLAYWKQMVDGIACLHNHGYVHRDIKGGNFLVSPDGSAVKVSDFGETRNGAQLRQDLLKHRQIPYPHQTPLFNAPSAVVLSWSRPPSPHTPKLSWSFVEPMRRTWAKRIQWDDYATGLSLLAVYYGAGIVELTRSSVAPKLAGSAVQDFLQFFTDALKSEQSYATFVAGLDATFHLKARMPDDMMQLVRGLLLERLATTAIDTSKAPFAMAWVQKPLPPTATTASAAASPAAASATPSAATAASTGPLSASVAALVAPSAASAGASVWAPQTLWVSSPKQ